MASILCWPTVAKHMVCPGLWLIYSFTLLEKNWFSLSQKLSIVKNFLMRVWLCVHFYFSVLRFCPVWVCSSLVYAISVSVSSSGLQHQRIWKMPFFFLSYQPPLTLKLFLPSLPQGSQSLELESFNEDNPFTSESFAFFMLFPVLTTIDCNKKLLWWGFSDALIHGYRNMYLVIVSLLCSPCRRIVVGFPIWPIGHDLSSVRLLAPLTTSCMHVISWNGP